MYEWIMSHMNESCHRWISHVTSNSLSTQIWSRQAARHAWYDLYVCIVYWIEVNLNFSRFTLINRTRLGGSHMCDMTSSHALRDSFTCVTCAPFLATKICMRHGWNDFLTCVTCMPSSNMWRDSFTWWHVLPFLRCKYECVMRGMTPSHVWHASAFFTYVMESYVWHASSHMWRHICDGVKVYHTCVRYVTHMTPRMCNMPLHMCDMPPSHMRRDSVTRWLHSFTSMTRLVHLCEYHCQKNNCQKIVPTYWRDSFGCATWHVTLSRDNMVVEKNKCYNSREVGGWGRDPKKCTGRDWGMGSSTI